MLHAERGEGLILRGVVSCHTLERAPPRRRVGLSKLEKLWVVLRHGLVA